MENGTFTVPLIASSLPASYSTDTWPATRSTLHDVLEGSPSRLSESFGKLFVEVSSRVGGLEAERGELKERVDAIREHLRDWRIYSRKIVYFKRFRQTEDGQGS